MNKIYYFLFLSLLLGACTKEDALEPTGANDDYFTVRQGYICSSTIPCATSRGARLRMGIRAGTRKPWTSAIR